MIGHRRGGARRAERARHHVGGPAQEPRRATSGAKTAIWTQIPAVTWQARPAARPRSARSATGRRSIPSFWPTLDATTPKTASGTSATTQSRTSSAARSRRSAGRRPPGRSSRPAPAARRGSSTRPIPRASVSSTSCARLFWAKASPTLLGTSSTSRSVTRLRRGGGVAVGVATRGRSAVRPADAGPDRGWSRSVRPIDHRDQRVDQVVEHHQAALPAPDVVGDDRAAGSPARPAARPGPSARG